MTREECEKKILEKLEEAIAIADEYCDGKCEYLSVGYFNEFHDCEHMIWFNNNSFEDETINAHILTESPEALIFKTSGVAF